MISWTKLLTAQAEDNDALRYSQGAGNIPKLVVWNVTSVCNLSCRHCYFDAGQAPDPNELSQKEAEAFIEDLAVLGVPVLLFSGGEPLLRKDILQLGRFARTRGIAPVFSTNGTLITEGVAQEIKQAGFSYVGISLDGTEETNDAFRQCKGAFKAGLNAIRECKKAGLKVGLRFTITRYNFKDLEAIFDIVEAESIHRLCLYHLVYVGRGKAIRQEDIDSSEKRRFLRLVWEKVLDLYRKGIKIEILTVDNHCDGAWIYLRLKEQDPQRAERALALLRIQGGNSSGRRLAAVDNCGNIYPDQFWRTYILGNIREKKFSAVWQDGENPILRDLRNRKVLLKGRCQRCNFVDICNGNFRARAEVATGEVWGEDPSCYLTDEEISEKCNLHRD